MQAPGPPGCLIAGHLSCMLCPLSVWLPVAQTGDDTPHMVGHYIKRVSLSFVSHLLSEPLSRTGKIPSFLWMALAPDVPLCLTVCMLGVLLGGSPGWGPITFLSTITVIF